MAYIHSVPGRLRVKCPSLKGNPRLARSVQLGLEAIQGVTEVRFNGHAHSLTVLHDPIKVSDRALLAHLRERGIAVTTPAPRPGAAPARVKARSQVTGAVLSTAATAVGGAFGRAVFGAVLKTSLERGVATLVTSAIR